MANRVVKIYLRIRNGSGKQVYAPAVWANKRSLRPGYALVNGIEEHHPEGVYCLRYGLGGKQVWEKVGETGKSDAEALSYKKTREYQLDTGKLQPKPQPAKPAPSEGNSALENAVELYASNIAAIRSEKTSSAYRYTLEQFLNRRLGRPSNLAIVAKSYRRVI